MNAYEVILRPVVTEKTMVQGDRENKYTFVVAKGTNKTQVAQAIEEIYGIKPVSVNVINVKPKPKRRGRYVGKTNAVRKAVVKFPEGQGISLFGEE